jgi:cell division septation protein DedD
MSRTGNTDWMAPCGRRGRGTGAAAKSGARALLLGALLVSAGAGGAAAQTDSVVGALFSPPAGPTVGTIRPLEAPLEDLATADCDARFILDCFVGSTVQTLARMPEKPEQERPVWAPRPQPPQPPAPPAAPALDAPAAAPTPSPTPAAAPPSTEPAAAAPGAATPAEEVEALRQAIQAAGLEGVMAAEIDEDDGVLRIDLPDGAGR